MSLGGMLALGLVALGLHLVSVTLTKALRTYSRSRLEEVCERHGHPERVDEVAHYDGRTERSAEVLAVMTGLLLAALLGVLAARVAPHLAVGAVLAITFLVGGMGYVLAGVVGRVFAEPVIDALWPSAAVLRAAMRPLTFAVTQVESFVEWWAQPADGAPRPASVEVEIEIEADGEEAEDIEADLPESARELLQQAVELTRRAVTEIMTPRSAIVTLPSTVTARAAAETFHETGKSRVPLFGENRDDIVGILYAKDLFPRMTDGSADRVYPRQLVRPAYFVPETKNAFELLEEFRSKRTQIAIVLDEYGSVTGLVTLEDLLEELVGAIDDEHDVPTPDDPVRALDGSRYEADATLSLEDLNDRLPLHLPTDADFLTLGGFAFHALGRLPRPGESFRHDGVEYTIMEVADHSIRRVQIDLQPAAAVGS